MEKLIEGGVFVYQDTVPARPNIDLFRHENWSDRSYMLCSGSVDTLIHGVDGWIVICHHSDHPESDSARLMAQMLSRVDALEKSMERLQETPRRETVVVGDSPIVLRESCPDVVLPGIQSCVVNPVFGVSSGQKPPVPPFSSISSDQFHSFSGVVNGSAQS